ncbi:MAG: endonuclease MutS2 [Ignavibacteriaceae bacterium]|nr:endonuclease MutS2 [Ignavibacteriaceae bacterium]
MLQNNIFEKLEYNKVVNYVSRYCHTEPGKQKLISLLPYETLFEAEREGQKVTEAKLLITEHDAPPFENIPDLKSELHLSRVGGAALTVSKIVQIAALASISRQLTLYLKKNREHAPLLAEYADFLYSEQLIQHHISRIINENGEVRDSASRELQSIRKEIISKSDDLRKMVQKICKSLAEQDIIRENYMTLRDGRIVVPVKAEYKRQIKGFIHSESSTGQTVYIEPQETLLLNNDIVSLHYAEQREIERILRELTARIGESAQELILSLDTIAILDTVFAKAAYSVECLGTFPELTEEGEMLIFAARHPLLLIKNGREKTVEFSIELEKQRTLLITGPNAGGKTVLIKAVGLLSLMAAAGFHIPAGQGSKMIFFRKFLIDIGDAQSIEDDLSTFSSHLKNIKLILDEADKNSLIILDEIGSGTEPDSGYAIAREVIEYLTSEKAWVFASTHLGKLKVLPYENQGVVNASMEFDLNNLQPTYRFRQGMPGSSYAIEIASRLGFSDQFIKAASDYAGNETNSVEKLLSDFELKSVQLSKKLREAEIELSRLNGLKQLYEQKNAEIKKEKNKILEKAGEEARKLIKDSEKLIHETIREIRSSGAEKGIVKKAVKNIENINEQTKNNFGKSIDSRKIINNFGLGDSVKIKDTQTIGTIVELNSDSKKAVISTGVLKVNVSLSELEPAGKKEATAAAKSGYDFNLDLKYKIDIRGYKPEEIEFEVIRFLDDAYSAGLKRVEILHGKGSGVLKNMVKKILSEHGHINKFYYASPEFGGEGITIAEISTD